MDNMGIRSLGQVLAVLLLAFNHLVMGYDLDPDSETSVKEISRSIAEDLMAYYKGHEPGQTPGLLPDPYYWWEAGALMGAMIDYYYYTGDDEWNDQVIQALMHQVGDFDDYMPENQTLTEGNDDQGFWGLAVMSAAEQKFPDPPEDEPQYLALAQAVFNTQAARWDTEHCAGGLRWQIFTWNKGYDYKNTISQGCFFALAARLALYTGNSSYAEWAERAWDWTVALDFIDDRYYVFDGAHITTNCTNRVPYQWSYNAGVFINGASAMYNYTQSDLWKDRLDNLIKGADVFFVGPEKNIMQEVACETVDLCNVDQQSFKAYLSRWMAATVKWAPHLTERIMDKLRPSSIAAAAQCNGGRNGRTCGLKWTENGTWDGSSGVGQQMMAMQVVLANLVDQSAEPATEQSGGTSRGDPAAGGDDIGRTEPLDPELPSLGPKDTAGAAILTVVVLTGLIATVIWMMMDETSNKTWKESFFDFRTALASGGGLAAIMATKTTREEVDEKGKQVEQLSASDNDSQARGTGPGVFMTTAPMREKQVNSRRAMDPKPTGATHERVMSGASGSWGGSGSNRGSFIITPDMTAPYQNQRHSKRLSKSRHSAAFEG